MPQAIPSLPKKHLLVLFLLFSVNLVIGQNFELAEVDISKLREQLVSAQNKEVMHLYLKDNFKATSEKYDLEYYEWDSASLCGFKEEFENGITYSVRQCEEAGGIRAELELPKMERAELMKWIEDIYQVNQMDMEPNVWKENNSSFEPKDSEGGCYFNIKEKENSTLVDLFCGC